jgi:hypothetical protein
MSSGHCQNVDFSILGGSITLASNNPFEAPNIDPGLLNFLSAKAWADYVLAPFGDLANVTSDAELDKYIRANTATIFHPVGTAAMSPKGAKWGVVDPDLRVKGTMGLRVVDASVLVNFITLLSEWAVTFFF